MFDYNFHIIRRFMQPSLQLFFHHSSLNERRPPVRQHRTGSAHCYEWLMIFYDVERIFQIKIHCLPQNKITNSWWIVQQPHGACYMLRSTTKNDIKAVEDNEDMLPDDLKISNNSEPTIQSCKCFSLVFSLNPNSKPIQNVAPKAPVAMADAPRHKRKVGCNNSVRLSSLSCILPQRSYLPPSANKQKYALSLC